MRLKTNSSDHCKTSIRFRQDGKKANNRGNFGGKGVETIIRSQKKGNLNVVFRQGKTFKPFKNSERIVEMTKELGINQSTVYFKLNRLKILKKYPKLKKSSLSLIL